jgi:hypothetical protein
MLTRQLVIFPLTVYLNALVAEVPCGLKTNASTWHLKPWNSNSGRNYLILLYMYFIYSFVSYNVDD